MVKCAPSLFFQIQPQKNHEKHMQYIKSTHLAHGLPCHFRSTVPFSV